MMQYYKHLKTIPIYKVWCKVSSMEIWFVV